MENPQRTIRKIRKCHGNELNLYLRADGGEPVRVEHLLPGRHRDRGHEAQVLHRGCRKRYA